MSREFAYLIKGNQGGEPVLESSNLGSNLGSELPNSEDNLSLVDENYMYRNLIFFSILLCILLSLIIFCLVITNWFHQFLGGWRQTHGEEEGDMMEGRKRRRRVIRALGFTRIEHWSVNNGHFPNNESCVICLEEFHSGELVRKLHCEHVFHVKCIDNWIIKTRAACPICKQRLIRRRHSQAGHDPADSSAEESDADLSPRAQMNPSGASSSPSAILLFAVTSPTQVTQPIGAEESPSPAPRDVLVEYFQTPEDAEENRGGRREVVLDFPMVQVSPVPVPISSENSNY